MTTAVKIADRALKRILVQADDAPLDPSDYADFYDAMNHYMAALETKGTVLGYTPVSNAADDITIPPGAIMGLIANMAINVAPDYGIQPSPALVEEAAQGMVAMRRLGRKPMQSSYGDNLPIGSGREGYTFRTDPLYDAFAAAILTLNGNSEVTELTATGTPVRVKGYWNITRAQVLQADINGRVTNLSDDAEDIDIDLSIRAIGDGTCTFHVYRNGRVSLATGTAVLSSTISDLRIRTSIKLEQGDYIEVWAQNDTDTDPITVTSAQFEVS